MARVLVTLIILALLFVAVRWAVRKVRAVHAARGPWKVHEKYGDEHAVIYARHNLGYGKFEELELERVPRVPREDYDARLYEARSRARMEVRLMNDKKGINS